MPSTYFDHSVWMNHEEIKNSDEVDNESLIYLPLIYNNDSLGFANGKYCDLIPFEMCLDINDSMHVQKKYTQLIIPESAHIKKRKLVVSIFIEENGSETLIFDISLETKNGSGIYKYSHQHKYSSQYFTYTCVDIKVLLQQKNA